MWVRGLLLLRRLAACRFHHCLACVVQTARPAPSRLIRPDAIRPQNESAMVGAVTSESSPVGGARGGEGDKGPVETADGPGR
jgi:hypothetical protein